MLCIIILIGMAIAFIFSKIYYNPIVDLISGFKSEIAVEGFHKDEFSVIKNVLENLQIKSRKYEEDDIFGKILLGEKIDESVEKLFRYKYTQTVVVYSEKVQRTYECTQGFIENNLQSGIDVRVVKDREYGFCILLNSDEFTTEKTFDYVYKFKEYINDRVNVFIVAGIGTVCSNISEIRNSYENAVLAIKYGDSSNENCIYEYNTEKGKNCSIYFPIEFESTINDCIYKGSREYLASYIDNIFKKNIGLPNLHMKNLVVEFINSFLDIAIKLNHEIDIEDISKHIQNEYRVTCINEYIKRIYITLVPEKSIHMDKTKEVGDFIIDYVCKNYSDQNVTIDGIASDLDLSSAYVSTLFKKATGISFSQYLLEYRLNKAKELLESTGEKVKEISETAGFGTYNNFAKAFRKKFGVSPSDYRNIKDSSISS